MIIIRPVKPDEADLLSQIAMAAKRHWNYPEHWMELWIPQLTFSRAYFVAHESWVAELDQTPIGWCGLGVRNGQAWLEDLWVLPEYIGRSVGKHLFTHVLELARQRGYQVLQLEADPNAVGFYEKMGMHKIGEHRYQLDGQPRILPLMEIRL